jgi:hypothetical protein
MWKRFVLTSAVVTSLYFLAGCGGGGDSQPSSSDTTQPAVADAPPPSVPIPPDSVFAKVHVGEEQSEVFATIGAPTSIETYQTGKAWIPFHYSGSDDIRQRAHYKGIGTITFSNDSAYSGGYNVLSVDYDPNERGY